jgi:hypothetical protein
MPTAVKAMTLASVADASENFISASLSLKDGSKHMVRCLQINSFYGKP